MKTLTPAFAADFAAFTYETLERAPLESTEYYGRLEHTCSMEAGFLWLSI
ncbi:MULTISPECIES: hypothetical protein [unclassified Pseudoalteromonas]